MQYIILCLLSLNKSSTFLILKILIPFCLLINIHFFINKINLKNLKKQFVITILLFQNIKEIYYIYIKGPQIITLNLVQLLQKTYI